MDCDFKEQIFKFGCCMVYFVVDFDLVYMAIKFEKIFIFFLFFNKGFDNGVGNLVNLNGFKLDYFWKEIFIKESFFNIFEKFV